MSEIQVKIERGDGDAPEMLNGSATSEEYQKLTAAGLVPNVAKALELIFQDELVHFTDLDDRAIEALKELSEDGALAVLKQFTDSNLQHVQNKSAFLCGVMKIHRQRTKAAEKDPNAELKRIGPPDEKIKELLDRTNYPLDITTGQRRYGGPPPKDVYDGEQPGNGCQVFIGKIPRNVYEDELVPMLEKAGTIWDFRLMMDPLSGQNRGYGFASFTTRDAAQECVKQMDNLEIRPKKYLGVCVSQSNCRLFVGSIPKSKTKEEIFDEFQAITEGLTDVIIYLQTEDKNKNRGFCFLEYLDHKAASQARRRLSSPKVKAFNNAISVDWADPIEEPSDEIMSKVKVLYLKNLSMKATEDIINTTFKAYGEVDRVKKIKDYAFVHFKEREHAMKALEELNGINIEGECVDISLAKPVDKKRKEKQMERKLYSGNPFNDMGYGGHRGRRGNRNGGNGYYGGNGGYGGYGMPPMGGYNRGYDPYYGAPNFSDDYLGYGFPGNYDDGFFGMGGGNQMPYGYNRGGRGMYGGYGDRGGKRGRGGRGNRGGMWNRGGPRKSEMAVM